MTPIPRLRAYDGPPILSYGFRPFFFFSALYAGLAVLIWLPMLHGRLFPPTSLSLLDWHAHEMLYGFVPAVMTGFLLTAIPNWTGRLPLQGMPLLILVTAWAAGRVAVSVSAIIGWLPAAIVDVAFLVLVAAATAREIVVGQNWRNLKVVGIVAILAAGNIVFHLESRFTGSAEHSIRVGIATIITLVTLIGGRIIPSFTRNWLVRENPGRLPTPFGRFDLTTIGVAAGALLLWIAVPTGGITAAALMLAAALHAIRLLRWAGDRTWREPLLLVLHVGYCFVPLGFAFTAFAALKLVPAGAGVHAWTVGAIGTLTVAVMTRATLGHTGRELTASVPTQLIYTAVLIAALARICASLEPGWSVPLLHLAALSWVSAFLGFCLLYGPARWRAQRAKA
jgi:uncharacterized protein involved in response to NO